MKTTTIALGLALAASAVTMQAQRRGGAAQAKSPEMPAQAKVENWGTAPDGKPAHLFTLTSPYVTVKLTDYGARLVSVVTEDKNGKKADILLGYPDLKDYGPGKDPYFGPIVGRFGNRIKDGKFTLEGHSYQLVQNEGSNTLHGGKVGFDRVMWKGQISGPESVTFTLVSPDGDQGFPGELTAHVTYVLEGHRLMLRYTASTTKPTVVNLTNHGYWNLHGMGVGTVLDQKMQIFADKYTPVANDLIPTGEERSVAGTAFDFRQPKEIGKDIHSNDPQLHIGANGGYDHNFVLTGPMGTMHPAVKLSDPVSGRTLEISTTEPGLQWYSGNGLQGTKMPNGQNYAQYGAVVLETQHFPDSPNEPKWPTTELKPGETMRSDTVYIFGVEK